MYVWLTVAASVCIILLLMHARLRLRVQQDRVFMALSLENQIIEYYQSNLRVPNSKTELDSFLSQKNDRFLSELMSINYVVKVTPDSIFIYELGLDGDDDQLKYILNDKVNLINQFFIDGDFLILKVSKSNLERSLVRNYFVYDKRRKLLTEQVNFQTFVNAFRDSVTERIYQNVFSRSRNHVRVKPGEELDTLVMHLDCETKSMSTLLNSEIVKLDFLDKLKDDYCNGLKKVDSLANYSIITIPIVFDRNKLMKQ